ncbi:MAG TPA: SPW repeat protein [Patescibacteria group bacterium]|nr:SPW repeat protein [Patescibacteria group bacterium]
MAMTLQQQHMTVRTLSGIDAVLGVWLILSPFLLTYYSITNAAWNDIIFGVAVAIFASMRTRKEGYRITWPSWVNVVIGLWLIISPFVLGYSLLSNVALWNNIIVGILVVILATSSAISTPEQ